MRYLFLVLLVFSLAFVPVSAWAGTASAAPPASVAQATVTPSGTVTGGATGGQAATNTAQAVNPAPVLGQAPTLDISAGIPQVSTQQFVAKLSGLAGRIYNIVGMLAPYLLLILFALAIFGFVFKALWKMLIFAVLGYVLLQFAPMLIGLMEHYFAH